MGPSQKSRSGFLNGPEESWKRSGRACSSEKVEDMIRCQGPTRVPEGFPQMPKPRAVGISTGCGEIYRSDKKGVLDELQIESHNVYYVN